MPKGFEPTHKIVLKPETETRHHFQDGTLVRINQSFIAGGGTMVMATCEDGQSQFVEYAELQLLIKT